MHYGHAYRNRALRRAVRGADGAERHPSHLLLIVTRSRLTPPFCLLSVKTMQNFEVLRLTVVIMLLGAMPGAVTVCIGQSRVVAWGAGMFVSSPPDFNNYGQSIVPAELTNALL